MKVAFFGGSFDPVHSAHVLLAKSVLERGLCDEVLAVPSFSQPFKPSGAHAEFEDRAAMLRLAFAGVPGVTVSEIEKELGLSPSYTSGVIRELRKRRPGDRFSLLIGGDSLAGLRNWHDAEFLASTCDFLVFPRRGAVCGYAELRRQWPEKTARKLAESVLNLPFCEISATMLRKKLANGENTANFISEKVLRYIQEKKLYQH